jgi:hypothetical protein
MEYFKNDKYDLSNPNVGLLVCETCSQALINHGHKKECPNQVDNVTKLPANTKVAVEQLAPDHSAEVKKLKTDFKGMLSPAAMLRELADNVDADPDHFADILVVSVNKDGSDYDWSTMGGISLLSMVGTLEIVKQDLIAVSIIAEGEEDE